MKFPSVNGDIATVHVDQKTTQECYVANLKVEPTRRLYTTTDGDQKEEDFTNGGRGHPPKHLKFFLLVFSKIKEELNKERIKPKANKNSRMGSN